MEIYILITSIWKMQKLPEEWKESITVPIHKKGEKKIVIIIGAHFAELFLEREMFQTKL